MSDRNQGRSDQALLCVVNFPANTGFAWTFIEGLYATVARHLSARGIVTYVAYPRIDANPETLAGSSARPVVLDFSLRNLRSLRDVCTFVREHAIRVVYLTDRPSRSIAYWSLRLAGVRRIIVHDHSSGARTRPRGLRYVAKWVLARVPGLAADRVIAVSDFVADRQHHAGLIPAKKVVRIWNGVPLPNPSGDQGEIRRSLALSEDRPLIACCCRAAPQKGVDCLLRAFDRVMSTLPAGHARPALVYVGDGPDMARLRQIRERLPRAEDVVFAGYSERVGDYLRAADICVVPSIWEEACPLGVLEALALAKPLVATRVGGIPEIARDGKECLLVPPGDAESLARAILLLLLDRPLARALGEAGRGRVAEHFTPERQVAALMDEFERGFDIR